MFSAVRTGLLALCCSTLGACFGEGTTQVTRWNPGGDGTELACAPEAPPATPTRLLTREEYDNTVRDLLGDATRPARSFPAEPRILGFENNASAHKANPLLVAAYLEAAEDIAARALAEHREALVPCDPAQVSEAECGRAFLDHLLPRAYRRPPGEAERERLEVFFEKVRATDGFDTAVEWTLQVILQSPQFLYRTEVGQPGTQEEGAVLDGYEVASRLSYFLWASMPDDALLAAAAAGELGTQEGVTRQARRLISDARATRAVQSFFRQWLHLDGMEKVEKTELADDAPVAKAWRGGIERFIETVWNSSGALSELLTRPAVHLDAATAPLYGIPPPPPGEWKVVEATGERAGLLTQPGLMAYLAGPEDSSPILRGVFVRERLLCQLLPAPPADIPIIPPDPDPNATTRERFAAHTANAACAGCHDLIDPVGFGFEQYDGLGRFRTTENGLPVDASGALTRVGDDLRGTFNGAVELSQRLAASAEVQDCVATQVYRFALGRLEAKEDTCALAYVQAQFRESGGDLRELMVAVATSHAFLTRAAPASEPEVRP
jgi:hypothetical protein